MDERAAISSNEHLVAWITVLHCLHCIGSVFHSAEKDSCGTDANFLIIALCSLSDFPSGFLWQRCPSKLRTKNEHSGWLFLQFFADNFKINFSKIFQRNSGKQHKPFSGLVSYHQVLIAWLNIQFLKCKWDELLCCINLICKMLIWSV